MLISKDSSSENNQKETKLVYSTNSSHDYDSTYVDAFSGKLLNYYGNSDNIDLKISTTIAKDSADYKYLQLAVNTEIIDNSGEFKASDLVTREEASMYLVKLLHYDKIGKLKDAFNFQPTDKTSISTDYVGYVSLAKTLGLINVDSNNNIRPKNNIIMEEVVKSVYNALQ